METKQVFKNSILDRLCDKISLFSSGLLMMLVSVVFIEVFARYLFKNPFTFTYDFTNLLFPWVVFSALIPITYRNQHINIILVLDKLPKKLKEIVLILNEFLTFMFILLIFLGAIQLTIGVSGQVYGNLHLPKVIYYLSLVFTLPFIIYLKINGIINLFKTTKKPSYTSSFSNYSKEKGD